MADNAFWKNGKRTSEYRQSLINQVQLWKCGVAVHNRFSDECTPDFACCYPQMMMPARERVQRANELLLEYQEVQ